jgi:hypothetical protein
VRDRTRALGIVVPSLVNNMRGSFWRIHTEPAIVVNRGGTDQRRLHRTGEP